MDNQNKKPFEVNNFSFKELSKYLFFFFLVAIFISIITGDSSNSTTSTQTSVPQVSQQEKASAQKELDELMALAKKAGLVKSYNFSASGNIVYADYTWYSQPVTFKKDFLAKVSTLKEKITGYHRFEVRDAYSNEKLAEVTAFSGSLEVYK